MDLVQQRICELIWDVPPDPSVFARWSQGFTFSSHGSKVTLVQDSGGPCSVIAPVQGFLIKNLLFDRSVDTKFNHWLNHAD